MIARSNELAAVLAARRRGAPGVVMSAPPGMGRTTVADAVAEALRAEGVDVVVVRATATSRAVPMAALAPLVVDLPPGGDVDGAIEHALLARDGLTLVVDDAHLLDDASATLLAGLLDGFAGRRSFLFATAVETAEPSPLLDHPALSHVQLRPLDEAGVSTILRAAGVSDEDVETWHQRSAGNPAALVRMIGGHEPGLLELSVDSSEVRRLLESVAVAESLSMDAATALLGNDHVDAVRQALDTGLIVTDSTMQSHVLRFRSPADADEVLSVLPPLRRRALVRATVDAVRDDGGSALGRSPRLVDLARHAGLDVDVEELRQASRAARHGDDGALALRLAEAAAASGDPDDVRHWVDVASERATDEQLDDALTALRDVAGRRDDLEAAQRVAEAQRDVWRRDDPEAALAHLDVDAPPIVAARAEVLSLLGRNDAAVALADSLVDHADALTSARAAFALAHVARQRGRPAAALALLGRIDASVNPNDLVSQHVPGLLRVLALLECGRWHEAEQAARQLRREAARGDARAGRAWADLAVGVTLGERGLISDASRAARAALAGFTASHQLRGARWASSLVALTAGLAGDMSTAQSTLAEAGTQRGATTMAALERRAGAWAAPDTSHTVDRLLVDVRELIDAGDSGAAALCLDDVAFLRRPGIALDLPGAISDSEEPMAGLRRAHVSATSRWRSPATHRTGVQVRLARRRPARRRVLGRRGRLRCPRR